MIEELTENKLREYGIKEDHITSILSADGNGTLVSRSDAGNYFVSRLEQKIYSGDDFYFKTESYMPFPHHNIDMMDEFYECNLKVFLNKDRKIAGKYFDESAAIIDFIEEEIIKAKIGSSKFIKEIGNDARDKKYIKFLHKKTKLTINQEQDTADSLRIAESDTNKKLNVKTYALMHVFLGKHDESKKITKINCEKFAKDYGISKATLLFEYLQQVDTISRQPESKNKNYLNPFFKRFEDAVNMLKPLNEKAFNYANNELKLLKIQYEVK